MSWWKVSPGLDVLVLPMIMPIEFVADAALTRWADNPLWLYYEGPRMLIGDRKPTCLPSNGRESALSPWP
jgi:hypothetical protein